MPIPQVIRIDPRDLDKNRAIGVSIPFNAGGVFRSTYSTKDQIKSNLINLLLTLRGERIENPEFGTNLPRLIFEQLDEQLYPIIQDEIFSSVNRFVPEVTLLNIVLTPDADGNTISIEIDYRLNISGQQDNIIIALQ
jgi:phage baseplate assembly protein W